MPDTSTSDDPATSEVSVTDTTPSGDPAADAPDEAASAVADAAKHVADAAAAFASADGDPDGRRVCSVALCPIGMALSAMNEARPDVIEHLLAAGQEFLLAAKAVVDARTGDLEERRSSKFEKIDIG